MEYTELWENRELERERRRKKKGLKLKGFFMLINRTVLFQYVWLSSFSRIRNRKRYRGKN